MDLYLTTGASTFRLFRSPRYFIVTTRIYYPLFAARWIWPAIKQVTSTAPPAFQPKENGMVERPISVHQFSKQSAAVNSGKDTSTCNDVNGVCRTDCHQNEYVRGRFMCDYPTNCCVLK